MRNLILKWLMGNNEFKAWRQIMSVDTGVWLGKNQKEVDAKIQNLKSDGTYGKLQNIVSGAVDVSATYVQLNGDGDSCSIGTANAGHVVNFKCTGASCTLTPNVFSDGVSLSFTSDEVAIMATNGTTWHLIYTTATINT